MADNVNHPNHYTRYRGVEVIDVTKHLPFCEGNAVKYLARAGHKGPREEDLRKALWYIVAARQMPGQCTGDREALGDAATRLVQALRHDDPLAADAVYEVIASIAGPSQKDHLDLAHTILRRMLGK